MGTGYSGALRAESDSRGAKVYTWLLSLFACAYCLWVGVSLYIFTGIFINMYASMGVDLPLSTKIVISSYRLLDPPIFGGVAVLIIVKQFLVRDKWANLATTLGATLIAVVAANWVIHTLYAPVLAMIEKLNK